MSAQALAGLAASQRRCSSSAGWHFIWLLPGLRDLGSRSRAWRDLRTSWASRPSASVWTLLLIVGRALRSLGLVVLGLPVLVIATSSLRRSTTRADAPASRAAGVRRRACSSLRSASRRRGSLLEALFRSRTSLGPVLVGRLVVLDPEGEGDLLLRRARRGLLHHAARPVVSAARPGARRRGVPCHGERRCRDPPCPVLALRSRASSGRSRAFSPSGCRPGSSGRSSSSCSSRRASARASTSPRRTCFLDFLFVLAALLVAPLDPRSRAVEARRRDRR